MSIRIGQDYLEKLVGRYSNKDQINYEIACGFDLTLASIICNYVQNSKKIFLVDPHYLTQKDVEKMGVKLNSIVECFRTEKGKLVTDVIENGSFKTIEVPSANVAYMCNALSYIDSKTIWYEHFRNRGYVFDDFVSGLSNLIADRGLLIIIDVSFSIDEVLEKLKLKFNVEERFNLLKSELFRDIVPYTSLKSTLEYVDAIALREKSDC